MGKFVFPVPFRSHIQKAFKRLWEFWIGPNYKRQLYVDPEIKFPNYPAPGSAYYRPSGRPDYKQPYKNSQFSTRYLNHQPDQDARTKYCIGDPINETIPEKLVRTGFLKKKHMENKEEVQKAKIAFEKTCEEELMLRQNVVDDFGVDEIRKNPNRKMMKEYSKHLFQAMNEDHAQQKFEYNMDDLYKPSMLIIKSSNPMFDDPSYRQLVLDMRYQLDEMTDKLRKQGYEDVYKGDPRFWRALDNTHDPKTIKMIQEAIKDQVTNLDLDGLEGEHNKHLDIGKGKMEFPIKSKIVE